MRFPVGSSNLSPKQTERKPEEREARNWANSPRKSRMRGNMGCRECREETGKMGEIAGIVIIKNLLLIVY